MVGGGFGPKGCALGLRSRQIRGCCSENPSQRVFISRRTSEGTRARGLLGVLVVEGATRQACVVKAVAALEEFAVEGVDCGLEELAGAMTDMRFWQGSPMGGEAPDIAKSSDPG